MTIKAKEWIYKIAPYKPGEGGADVIKLASNENALGPSPKAMQAYASHVKQLHRYPQGTAAPLRQAIADKYDLDADRVICTAGSDELIRLLVHAYVGQGDEVVFSEYGFLMYKLSTMQMGGTPVSVPENNLTADVGAILDVVTDKTKLVFLANPNNPTGTCLMRSEIERLYAGLPDHVLLVLDCAYAEFVEDTNYTDGLDMAEKFDRVIVLRTFSKIYGLGGLRIGWGYGSQSVIDVLHRIRGAFNVTSPSIEAGVAALSDDDFVQKSLAHNKEWLAWSLRQVRELGYLAHDSYGNFFLLDFETKDRARDAFVYLRDHDLFVRPLNAYGLDQYLRVSIGTGDEMHRFIELLRAF